MLGVILIRPHIRPRYVPKLLGFVCFFKIFLWCVCVATQDFLEYPEIWDTSFGGSEKCCVSCFNRKFREYGPDIGALFCSLGKWLMYSWWFRHPAETLKVVNVPQFLRVWTRPRGGFLPWTLRLTFCLKDSNAVDNHDNNYRPVEFDVVHITMLI